MGPFLSTVATLAVGLAVGALSRLVLPPARRLSWAALTVAGALGASLGEGLHAAVTGDTGLGPGLAVASLAGGLVAVALAAVVAARLRRGAVPAPPADVRDLIAAGEGEHVEFKASARLNAHTGTRDEQLELVVARTVAGFLNADGGTLLVGVADDGTVVGLDGDYVLMKRPDRDRYELWLRDLLGTCLGGDVAALVKVGFADVDGHDVCRVDVPPSPRPVFLDRPKGPRTAEVWVRSGNSTRQLLADELLDYRDRRWGS